MAEAGVPLAGTTTYGYDAEDRLTSVVTGGTTTATYAYDGDGDRVGKTVGGTTTPSTWDRTGLGGLGAVIGDGSGENVFGPTGLQERVAGGAAQYAQGDGLGSVRLVTDAAGSPVGTATYDAWGAPQAGSATLGGFGFAGEQADAETGFVYLRARTYDPATGQFLQRPL
ncbi:MAG TPA: RHS repeat-associated core domain-containing protein, partial [Thermomicrobiales bacterium]|nr:RHS repeat-associated core domain-containing protein [Thermomicrobiales bacterium]